MELRFLNIIKNYQELSNDQPIVIAFSGGMDSVCLLNLLSKLKFKLIIAHYNHGIRENASRDEEFSRLHAQAYNHIFISEKGNVLEFAREYHLSVEEAARKKRYEFLFRVAQSHHASYIATGHHADDQVETTFMHLLRGSGLSGLIGMNELSTIPEYSQNIKIFRPLLSFWRSEIEVFCQTKNLQFIVDETNFTSIYERNKIRNEILPALNKEYPGLNQRLWNLSNIISHEDQIIQEIVDQSWNSVILQKQAEFIQLNAQNLREFSEGLLRRIIRKAVYTIQPDLRDLTFRNVENVIEKIHAKSTGEIDLQENLIAVISQNELIIGNKSKNWIKLIYPQIQNQFWMNLLKADTHQLSEGWNILINILPRNEVLSFNTDDDFSTFLDYEKLEKQIGVRSKKDGDIFQPIGMKSGKIKVSDFFINEKLIQPARKNWPLITDSKDEIIWIPGYKPCHNYRITPETRMILQIKIEKE